VAIVQEKRDNSKIDIYIDITNMLSISFISGIQRVVREGTKYLILNQNALGWHIFLLRWMGNRHAYQIIDSKKYLLWLKDNGIGPVGGMLDTGLTLLPEQIHAGALFFDIDSVWPNEPPRYYLYTILKHRDVKIAVLIHDVITMTHPQYSTQDQIRTFLPYLDAGLAYADLCVTTTEFTRNEIKKMLEKMNCKQLQFSIAPLGANFIVCRKSDPKIDLEVKGIANTAPYLLTVATIEPRKNHKVILDAYDLALKNTNVNIVFAGRKGENMDAFLRRLYRHPQYGKRIFHFEGKNDETISYLYQKALYTILPTYIEGFGIPVVESLIANTPPLLSDIPVMREVAGDYAQYFDPDSPVELAELLMSGLSDPEEYRKRKAALQSYRPHTWEDFGKALENGILSLYDDYKSVV